MKKSAATTQSTRQPGGGTCPRCQDKGYFYTEIDGYTYVKKCACQRKQAILEALEQARIPARFRNTTLEDKPGDGRQPFKPYGGEGAKRDPVALKSQVEAIQICRKLRDIYLDVLLHNKPRDDLYGLLLYGDCGRGKTRLACSLICDLVYAGLTDVMFMEYNELFKLIRFSFKSEEITYQGIFDALTKAKVLVIDDFGTEVGGDLIWVLDNMGYIINERYAANKPTILTCNYWKSIKEEPSRDLSREKNLYEDVPSWKLASALKDLEQREKDQKRYEELQDRIGYRLRSRIREMCYEFKLEGYDYRKRIGKNRDILLQRSQRGSK